MIAAISAATGAAISSGNTSPAWASEDNGEPTEFQIACMTLPYSAFPLKRALVGIKSAGYRFVAWGTSHQETSSGEPIPVLPTDAPPHRATELAKQCRDLGLEPLMMFSTIYPEAENGLEMLTQRIRQASAARLDKSSRSDIQKGEAETCGSNDSRNSDRSPATMA